MSFQNKVVWITGASSGIGRALAMELDKQGALLILSARKEKALNEVKNACKNSENIKVLPLDLEAYDQFDKKVEEALKWFGRIDILVNNGGISQRALAKDTALDVDKRIMEINYMGTIALTKALLPHFIERKQGHYVVTTSIVGRIASPLRSTYAGSKHALHGFFDSFRAEVFHDNISVTLICPGYVTTEISMNALTGDGSAQQSMDKATENGINPERFAKLMAKAIAKKKQEAHIAGAKEKLGVFVKRFFPRVFAFMIRKLSVT